MDIDSDLKAIESFSEDNPQNLMEIVKNSYCKINKKSNKFSLLDDEIDIIGLNKDKDNTPTLNHDKKGGIAGLNNEVFL